MLSSVHAEFILIFMFSSHLSAPIKAIFVCSANS